MEKLYKDSETGCCPRFNPEPWQEKEVIFKDRLFIKDKVRCFLHIPIGFGKVMVKNVEKIQKADALPKEPLMLADCKPLWHMDLYIAVGKDVPDANLVRLSGTFLTKVYEGSYGQSGKWIKDMKKFVESKGKKMNELYTFYTTCPACAKAYGKNYTVLLVKV